MPHDYQRYCIRRLVQDRALALFLDMGLGKTVVTLTAVNDLRYNRFAIRRCLVIAPLKVAEDTWVREQGKWDHLHLLRIVPVLGGKNRRIRALNSPGDVYVTNRENVPWLVDYYRNDWPFDMVVIDELSSFKSHQAQRFKKLKLVRMHINRIAGLTGTPSPNGLMDLWAQIYLLDGGRRLGRTITEYRENYFTPGSRNRTAIFSYVPLPGAEEAIRDRLRDICISMQAKDYLTLPPKVENVRYVKLDNRAQKAYREMGRERILEFGDTVLDAGSAGVLSGKLLQICNGAVYGPGQKVVEIHDNKIQAFMEMVEECAGSHMLVFYSYRHDLDRLKKALMKTKLRTGELKSPADITAWNSGQLDVLLAHPASAAYGLNLQAGGNIIIWFGLTWSLELYRQANARLYRQGQEQRVFIHHLVVSGGYDEDVMAALEKKGGCQAALLESLRVRIRMYGEGDAQ